MFHKTQSKKPVAAKKLDNLLRVVNAPQALAGEKRQQYIQRIEELMAMDEKFHAYCQVLIDAVVAYYQELPETRNSYFAERGGLLEHALSRTETALGLCRAYFITNGDDKKQQLSEIQLLWLYALFSASLLQGIGKLIVDLQVDIYDKEGEYQAQWHPLIGSLHSQASYYQYDFCEDKPDDFRRRLNLILARQLMPTVGFEWIAKDKGVLEIWLALLNEDFRSAGTLGPILLQADALSIERYFNEKQIKNFAQDAGKSRYSLGSTFNPAIEPAQLNSLAGAEFIKWLSNAVREGKLMINKAPLWMVPGGLLMCPDIFKLFVREYPQFKNWQQVQQGFMDMKLHEVDYKGDAIGRFEQRSQKIATSGAVLSAFAMILPDKVNVINPQTGAKSLMSKTDVLKSQNELVGLTAQKGSVKNVSMQVLNAQGQWVNKPETKPASANTNFDSNG